jgi:hypothetical protein
VSAALLRGFLVEEYLFAGVIVVLPRFLVAQASTPRSAFLLDSVLSC